MCTASAFQPGLSSAGLGDEISDRTLAELRYQGRLRNASVKNQVFIQEQTMNILPMYVSGIRSVLHIIYQLHIGIKTHSFQRS